MKTACLIKPEWVAAFADVFDKCAITRTEQVILLSETDSAKRNLDIARLALGQLNLSYLHLEVPSLPDPLGPLVRSSGASTALSGQDLAVKTMQDADIVIDMTVEGLMHAVQTPSILKSGTRIMTISQEHPDALARLSPQDEMKDRVKDAVARCRLAKQMQVTSPHGTALNIDMTGAANVGVWGWTDKPGTLAHWPGGIVVSFPAAGSVNGRLVMAPGDMNLSFKRYIEQAVDFTIVDDFITIVDGEGSDARLIKDYLAAFDSRAAYATSHVGWGLNEAARYEALAIYDKAETNGTELRAVAGNFLYSTGANEFAGRFTRGHFDLPMMGCDIWLDGHAVVRGGALA
jgi:2,5-dihydroxypyridine 5,6-dioxygenase